MIEVKAQLDTIILKTFSSAAQTLIRMNQTKPDRKNDSNSDILNQQFPHIQKEIRMIIMPFSN